jgi:hypothetical protein
LGGCAATQGGSTYGYRFDGERNVETAPPVSPDLVHASSSIGRTIMPGSFVVRGSGESMLPTTGENTLFVVVPTKWEDLVADDHVIYKDPNGRMIAHRLVRLEGDHWIVKGDNNSEIDPWVMTRDNYVGVISSSFFPPATDSNP